ncbi:MAG: hypothetical protein QM702_10930 [Rubrivivax sp.]
MADRIRVLVVEDDILIGTHIAETLTSCGYPAVLATSVADAERELSASSYAAVVLDFRVGDDISLGFALGLQQRGIPFFFCTGSMLEDVQGSFGCARVLCKPFSDEDLASTLAEMLAAA